MGFCERFWLPGVPDDPPDVVFAMMDELRVRGGWMWMWMW